MFCELNKLNRFVTENGFTCLILHLSEINAKLQGKRLPQLKLMAYT